MQHHIVHNPDGPDLEFDGELLLKEHHHDTGFVEIYATVSAQYVVRQNHSSRPGTTCRNDVRIYESLTPALQSLGHGRGAKAIAAALGHPMTQRVD